MDPAIITELIIAITAIIVAVTAHLRHSRCWSNFSCFGCEATRSNSNDS